MSDPTDYDSAVEAVQAAMNASVVYGPFSDDLGKIARGAIGIIKSRTKTLDRLEEEALGNKPRKAPPGTYRVVYVDPLAIDLNGDGLQTVGLNGLSSTLFDHDADGIRTASGWLKGGPGSDDVWLVRDINHNGSIDSGTEMFGDQTLLPNGQKAISGLQAIAALDGNHDGKLDNQDTAWSELQVWQDSNQNGITDAGELKTLESIGLQSIATITNAPSASGTTATAAGDYINNQVVTVTRVDGTTTTATDLNLSQEKFYSQYTDRVQVPESLRTLPNLTGMGRLRDLREAAALSPALASVLSQFSSGTSRAEQKALIGELLTEWAKTDPKYNRPVLEELKSWGIQDANSPNVIYVRRSAARQATPFMVSPNPSAVDESFAHNVRVMDAIRGTESGVFYARTGINWRGEYQKQVQAIEEALYDSNAKELFRQEEYRVDYGNGLVLKVDRTFDNNGFANSDSLGESAGPAQLRVKSTLYSIDPVTGGLIDVGQGNDITFTQDVDGSGSTPQKWTVTDAAKVNGLALEGGLGNADAAQSKATAIGDLNGVQLTPQDISSGLFPRTSSLYNFSVALENGDGTDVVVASAAQPLNISGVGARAANDFDWRVCA